jgi:hypothetical protein
MKVVPGALAWGEPGSDGAYDTGWQTHTWHVTDASFSKMWGYDFSFRPEQSVPFVIGQVERLPVQADLSGDHALDVEQIVDEM